MTQPEPQAPQPVNEFGYTALNRPESRLDELLAKYDAVKDAADEAKALLDALTKAIKTELTGVYTRPDGAPYAAYHLGSPALAKPLHLRWTVSGRLNTADLRATFPDIAERFTEQKGTWVLARDRK